MFQKFKNFNFSENLQKISILPIIWGKVGFSQNFQQISILIKSFEKSRF